MTLVLVVLHLAVFLLEQAAPERLIDTFALWPPAYVSQAGAPVTIFMPR